MRFWHDAFRGNLGVSHIYRVNVPVVDILQEKLPISVQMGVLAMLVSLAVGIPLGLVMGRFKHRLPDKLGTGVVILIQAVPAAVYYLYIQMYGNHRFGCGAAVPGQQLAVLGAAGVLHEPGQTSPFMPCGLRRYMWTRATRTM